MVTEVTINREVKVRGGPMRGGYSTTIDAENDFILNSHILTKLRKELKNKMNLKTDCNHKESTPGDFKKHEEQIAGLVGSLNNYGDPFHGAAQNMTAGAEKPSNMINGILSARKYDTERVEQFIKKRLLSREVSFYNHIQRSTISTLLKKRNKER